MINLTQLSVQPEIVTQAANIVKKQIRLHSLTDSIVVD